MDSSECIEGFISKVRGIKGCSVLPPKGLPETHEEKLPGDLEIFFTLCGGMHLFSGEDYGLTIVSPDCFVRANPVIANTEGRGDISYYWYIIARSGAQFVTIDLSPSRMGRCYDSFWDRHAVAGSCPVIAKDFCEFLNRILSTNGKMWYWLNSAFLPYGDAYDSF